MPHKNFPFTRRSFLKTSLAAAAGAAALPIKTYAFSPAQTTTYTRYNVMSEGGKKALQSYATGIQAMLNKHPDDPQNWFRNAFVHLMDCPHGNWWFYVWHRGYVGFFEETIRNLSNDPTFAMPYWDWTAQPYIPDSMFDGVRTPTYVASYDTYIHNLDVFTAKFRPSLEAYWASLSAAQRSQLNVRGYSTFQDMWNDVTGNGDPGNEAFATTANARYLSRTNPKLDPATAQDCSAEIIKAGLQPTDYYNQNVSLSFTSSKTPSHMTPPGPNTQFSTIEGLPHNKVHNCIGGVGPLGPGPYGYMTNFLSPVDPIFFLHHANIDRLWVSWTTKQQQQGYPILPSGSELAQLSDEQFLFYVRGDGQFVGPSRAADYLSTDRFHYQYEPGFGDNLQTSNARQKRVKTQVKGVVKANRATLTVPSNAVREHLAPQATALVAEVTVPHPSTGSQTREFHVLVGAPEGVTQADPTSPFFAGTVAFFGNMSHHAAGGDATFAVPLPKAPQAFKGLATTNATIEIRIVPANGGTQQPPLLKRATIRAL